MKIPKGRVEKNKIKAYGDIDFSMQIEFKMKKKITFEKLLVQKRKMVFKGNIYIKKDLNSRIKGKRKKCFEYKLA